MDREKPQRYNPPSQKKRRKNKMRKKVRTLLRVSSKQQLHDDDIPLQRAETHKYILTHKDWIFDKEYIERAVSAYKNSAEDRDILQDILEDARKGEFDVLLAYMSDRIGRQEEYAFYVATLNRLGIEVWTINDGQLKTEDHVDKLITYIKFWQNEGESKKTSQRVHDAQIEMVKSGKFVGGKAPYGYRLVDSGLISNHGRLLKKLEIIEEQAEIVRKIYSLAVHQGYGYQKIANQLNKEGIPAPSLPQWKNGTIRSILTNPIYMGYYAINRRKTMYNKKRMDRKEWTLSEHQIPEIVIVSEQEWEKAQRIRESRKDRLEESKKKSLEAYEEQYNVPFSSRGKLPLLDLCYCGYCGKRLKNSSYINHWTTKDGEKKVSYIGRYQCPENCKERASYSQDYLDSIVFSIVDTYMENLKAIDISEEIKIMQQQLNGSIEKELQSVVRESNKLRVDIATLEEKIPEAIRGEYFFSIEKLSSMIKEKEQRLEEFIEKEQQIRFKIQQNQIASKDLEKFISIIPNWKEEFENADMPTKKMLLSSLIDRIEVKDMDIRIKFKIRLEDFFDLAVEDENYHETMHEGVPRQRLQFYYHLIHSLRSQIHTGQKLLPEHLTHCG